MIPPQDWNKRQGKRQRKVPVERLVAEDGFHFLCHIVTVRSWAWLQRDRQIPTMSDGCFSTRAPRGDLANCLPQPLHSDNHSVPLWALRAVSLQGREIVTGGEDGDVHLPPRLAQLPSRSSISRDGFTIPTSGFVLFEIQLPPACLGRNPALESAPGADKKCISAELNEYVWDWRELSWNSSIVFSEFTRSFYIHWFPTNLEEKFSLNWLLWDKADHRWSRAGAAKDLPLVSSP